MRYRCEFRRYRLPFRGPVRTAHGVWPVREGVILRLADEQGGLGYGEAAPIPDFGTETIEEIVEGCAQIGADADDARLDAVPHRLGCLRHALAAARAKSDAAPAHKYLAVAALLPAGRAVLGQIAARVEGGFRVFKWKVGVGDVADELALFDDVCAALPGGAKLRLDANGAWDRRAAERWLERCADRPVEYVEQPCFAAASQGATAQRRSDDLLLGLAGDFPTPIALDESVAGDGDIERWLGLGWSGVFVIKPSLLGDVPAAVAALERARSRVVFSSALETVVGARAALRIAFAWAGELQPDGTRQPRALGFGVWPLFADTRFDGPAAAPFIRAEDLGQLDPEVAWSALN